ncbi:hypothetical protein PCE1_002430 [Barthelona sp. PCE]
MHHRTLTPSVSSFKDGLSLTRRDSLNSLHSSFSRMSASHWGSTPDLPQHINGKNLRISVLNHSFENFDTSTSGLSHSLLRIVMNDSKMNQNTEVPGGINIVIPQDCVCNEFTLEILTFFVSNDSSEMIESSDATFLEQKDFIFKKGMHTFDFSIFIPSNYPCNLNTSAYKIQSKLRISIKTSAFDRIIKEHPIYILPAFIQMEERSCTSSNIVGTSNVDCTVHIASHLSEKTQVQMVVNNETVSILGPINIKLKQALFGIAGGHRFKKGNTVVRKKLSLEDVMVRPLEQTNFSFTLDIPVLQPSFKSPCCICDYYLTIELLGSSTPIKTRITSLIVPVSNSNRTPLIAEHTIDFEGGNIPDNFILSPPQHSPTHHSPAHHTPISPSRFVDKKIHSVSVLDFGKVPNPGAVAENPIGRLRNLLLRVTNNQNFKIFVSNCSSNDLMGINELELDTFLLSNDEKEIILRVLSKMKRESSTMLERSLSTHQIDSNIIGTTQNVIKGYESEMHNLYAKIESLERENYTLKTRNEELEKHVKQISNEIGVNNEDRERLLSRALNSETTLSNLKAAHRNREMEMLNTIEKLQKELVENKIELVSKVNELNEASTLNIDLCNQIDQLMVAIENK